MRGLLVLFCIVFLSACATWNGVKKDSKDAKDWTIKKVNQGASYIKEKTD